MPAIMEEYFSASDGKRVWFRSSTPGNPESAVILLHGIGEHSGRYLHVMNHLADLNTAVLAPDHRGHGLTAELPGYVESFERVILDIGELTDLAKKRFQGLPVFIFGHSLGGLLAVLSLLAYRDAFRGAILSAAAVAQPDGVPPALLKAASFLSKYLPKLPVQKFDYDHVCRDPEVIRKIKEDPLFYRGKIRARTGYGLIRAISGARDRISEIGIPVLLLHGENDSSVSLEASRFIESHVSSRDRTLVVFPGLVHEILNEPEKDKVFSVIDEWLTKRISATRNLP